MKNQKLFIPLPLWTFSTSSYLGALLSFWAITRIVKVAAIMPIEKMIQKRCEVSLFILKPPALSH